MIGILADTATVTSTLSTALSSVASDAQAAIIAVLPVALPVLGAIIVIGIGIRVFKKASSSRG